MTTFANGSGKHHPRGVDGLPDVLPVHPAGDFLDEHRSQALGAEPFVHAEEVDLGHLNGLLKDLVGESKDTS